MSVREAMLSAVCVKSCTRVGPIFFKFFKLYFKSSWTGPDLGIEIGRIRNRIWRELVFGSQNNAPVESNSAVNAVIRYKE